MRTRSGRLVAGSLYIDVDNDSAIDDETRRRIIERAETAAASAPPPSPGVAARVALVLDAASQRQAS